MPTMLFDDGNGHELEVRCDDVQRVSSQQLPEAVHKVWVRTREGLIIHFVANRDQLNAVRIAFRTRGYYSFTGPYAVKEPVPLVVDQMGR